MRVHFDVGHPAHVHLFKHAIRELNRAGHETRVLSRDKEVTVELLDAYDVDHELLSRRRESLPAAILEQGVREIRTLGEARAFDPDVVVSRVSPPAIHAAALLDAKSVVVTDTDVDDTLLGRTLHAVTLPVADVVCRPPTLDIPTDDGKQHVLGFQELAYLHPDRFSPDRSQLEAAGVDVDETYFVLRLSSWDAYHDVGHHGIDEATLEQLVDELSAHGTVYASTEEDLSATLAVDPLPIPPHLVHDLLYFADMYVGDSGTMSTEAAMLGTPAIRMNSIDREDDDPTFVALESEYGLLYSYSDGANVLEKVDELLTDDDTTSRWRQRRAEFLEDVPDVTDELLAIIYDIADAPSTAESVEATDSDDATDSEDITASDDSADSADTADTVGATDTD